MRRSKHKIVGTIVFLSVAAWGCDTKENAAPGATEEQTGPRGDGVSPGLGSGTGSSGAPDWMQRDGSEASDQQSEGAE